MGPQCVDACIFTLRIQTLRLSKLCTNYTISLNNLLLVVTILHEPSPARLTATAAGFNSWTSFQCC